MKIINKILEFVGHFLIYLSCYFNLPSLCAYIIRISIRKKKFLPKKIKSKKVVIVLDREIGHRDMEIIRESSNKTSEFLFFRRSITKVILSYFCKKKKFFFNYSKPSIYEEDYFNQNKNYRKKHEQFWTDIILNLKRHYNNKTLNFITFNYTYYAEIALYVGCKKNNVPVKLWHKEGIKTAAEAEIEAKTRGVKFKQVFKYFTIISVYNKLIKKMFIKIDKSNKNKIIVSGCPRIEDYMIKKKYSRKIKTLLFLSFGTKRGIPSIRKNLNLNWNSTYNKVIKILNELSNKEDLKIILKTKSNSINQIPKNINKKINVFTTGTAQKYINQADIIIGHNSASTIEALINGKFVMVPFFEKKLTQKKYLYNFHKELVYTSEKNMKKSILNLVNKKVSFPLNNKKHQKTIQYYLGNSKNTKQKHINFLNS